MRNMISVCSGDSDYTEMPCNGREVDLVDAGAENPILALV